MRLDMEHDAGLHFVGMIAVEVGEIAGFVLRFEPVQGTGEQLRVVEGQFPDHRLEVISSVAVENDQLGHRCRHQYVADVSQNSQLRAWQDVHAEFDVELAGLHAKGNGGQHEDFGAPFPGLPGSITSTLPSNSVTSSRADARATPW